MSSAAVANGEQPASLYRNVVDALVAGGWLTIGLAQFVWPDAGLWTDGSAHFAHAGPLSLLVVALVCVPTFWWRRSPLVAFAASWSAIALLVVTDHRVGLLPFTAWLLVYGVGAFGRRHDRAAAIAIALAGVTITRATHYPQFDTIAALRTAALLGGCLVLGVLSAAARRTAQDRIALAEQRSLVATQRAQSAVVEERLRLARELHDVVAHSMSVISVQSSMASAAFDTQPARTRQALVDIERTSRATLSELRGLLGVLRSDDGARPATAPVPSLRDVAELVRNLEGVGVRVELVQQGPGSLPPGVDAFAFRIVQEALTNVVKHARATVVEVEIVDDGSMVAIRIADDGRAVVDGRGDGHGIVGMNERVRAFGGSLHAGPAADGGFVVMATLPYGTSEPTGPSL